MKTRIISAVVLLTIFIPILLIGKIPFAILMVLLSLFGLYELLKVRETKKKFPFLMKLIAYFLVIVFTLTNYNTSNLIFSIDYRIMAVIMFSYLLPIVFINDNKKYNLNDALFLTGSTLFIGMSFNLLIMIRNIELNYIIYIFGIAALTDTFALLTGRRIGKNKLAPKISPNKTIEGSIGGSFIATFVGTIYFVEVINPSINIGIVIFITLLLSILGQLGDLAFSAIKRYYDTKDFSNLIPGHGGILDRLDSVIFVTLGFLIFLSIL